MTDQPTPETDAEMFLRPPSVCPSYVPYEFARALEIQRNEARAERDEHIARNNDSLLALHIATAERDALRAAFGIAQDERIPAQTPRPGSLLVETGSIRRRVSLTDERDAELAAAQQTVALLRAALEGMMESELALSLATGYAAEEIEAAPHWKAARAALAALAQ